MGERAGCFVTSLWEEVLELYERLKESMKKTDSQIVFT